MSNGYELPVLSIEGKTKFSQAKSGRPKSFPRFKLTFAYLFHFSPIIA